MTKYSALRVLGGATILAGAVATGVLLGATRTTFPQGEEAAAAAPPEAPRPPGLPSFDVVRTDARGMVVVAGRAAPGAQVALHEGGRAIAQTLADSRGEWVMLPDQPLGAGPRELSLRARAPGGEEVRGVDTVLVVGPAAPVLAGGRPGAPAGPAPEPPLVLLLPPIAAAAPRALAAPLSPASPSPAPLALDIVDYDEGDAMRFAGTAPPGAQLRVWSDSRHLGDTAADGAGRWSLSPAAPPPPGRHVLQVDQLAGATPVRRIQVAFEREVLPAGRLREGEVVVQPGNNLWRIAREAYGQGIRYTVIYRANREQIRSPDRIYPGQRLALPATD